MLFCGLPFATQGFNDLNILVREHWRDIDIVNPESWTDVSPSGTETWTTISPSGDESWVDISTRIIQDVNMASTYTANTGIEKIASGEQAGTWGTTTNTNFDIIDDALNGVLTIAVSGAVTLTTSDGAASNGHHKVILLTTTTAGAFNVTIAPNDVEKLYFIKNGTDQTATILQGGGTGTTVAMAAGASSIIYADGTGANSNVGNISTDVLGDTSPQLGGNLDTNGKKIQFGDAGTVGTDDTLEFGADADLKIYHDGSHSYINDSGTGNLRLAASQVDVMGGTDSGETMATFVDNGAVTLYHDNTERIATSSAGVTITGTVTIGSAVVTEAQLEILDGATVTTDELNNIDGGTSATSTTVVDADRVVLNDGGTMVQAAVTDISTYMNGNAFSVPSAISSTSTLTPGAAKSIYQRVDTSSADVTVTVAVGSLAIGQYVVLDKTNTNNAMAITWASNSGGVSLGSDVDIAVGFYNGTAFSFIETIKSQAQYDTFISKYRLCRNRFSRNA